MSSEYGNLDGLAGWSINPWSGQNSANSQYSLLNNQTKEFGDYGTNLTNGSLKSNQNLSSTDSGMFGLKDSTWGNIGTIGQLGLGALSAYTNWGQLELAKDAFSYNKEMKDKEYAMAKDAYDRRIAKGTSITEQINAGATGSGTKAPSA